MSSPTRTEPRELRFFALGSALSRGAFAYAELAKAADGVAQMRSRIAQVGQLAKLAPVAERNRKMAGEHIAQALALMRALDAPPAALAPVEKAAARLAGPVPVSSDARPLLLVNRDAARVLSSLAEFRALSSLPADPALSCWLGEAGRAGVLVTRVRAAADHALPALLPPAPHLAADLSALRDWLARRGSDAPVPDSPMPESDGPLTGARFLALGDFCRRVEAL